MMVISLLIGLVAVALLLPTASDLLSLARIATGRRRRAITPAEELPRLLFLVPAHNEELLIESCVRSLVGMRYPATCYSVVVIADNCTDRTSPLARAAGARCLERHDQALPGKPRAIAWALERLPRGEYDAVAVVDADVVVDPEFAEGLATAGSLRHKAVQPYNDVRNPADSAVTRMASVLAASRYRGSFLLKRRVGLNTPLSAGMCVGSRVLAVLGWRAFSIGEDWEWYAMLTAHGVPIDYACDAHLYAQEARSLRQGASQRRRWMAGKLTVLFRRGPDIARSRAIGLHQKLDALAELAAPGPAVHLGLVMLLGGLALAAPLPAGAILAGGLVTSLARPVTYALVGLATDPEPLRALAAFAFLPIYTIWRMRAAAGALWMLGDRPWIRTERH